MLVLDELRTANWMRSKDGAKGRNRPKPVSPLKAPKVLRVDGVEMSEQIGRPAPSQEEVRAWLDSIGPQQQPVPPGAPDVPHEGQELLIVRR